MENPKEPFGTNAGCIDGREKDPIKRLVNKLAVGGAKFVDTITEPGLVGKLADPNVDPGLLESVRKQVDISIRGHHSRVIVVSGHQECLGHPVDDPTHIADIIKATNVVRGLVGEQPPVVGAFVRRRSVLPGWRAEVVDPKPQQPQNRLRPFRRGGNTV